MLSTNKDFSGINTHDHPQVYYLLSTDPKPIKNVINGAVAFEIDTCKVFFFDKENTKWWGEE